MTRAKSAPLTVQIAGLTANRLLLNSAFRMTYPFLPALARGLGVSLSAVAGLVALRSFAGFFSPLFSPLSERFGRRPVLVGSMLALGLGSLIVAAWSTYWALGAALAVIGLAKVVFDPAMQSYLGDVVPYATRGRALAFTEFSWAGAMLVGAPAIGFIIDRQGWSAPFFWLAVGGLGGAILLWRLMPEGQVQITRAASLSAMLDVMRANPVIWAAAGFVFLAAMANELLLIVYGDWMEQSFRLSLTNLGLATAVIGVGEITGEAAAAWSVDRFGKRPVVIASGLLLSLLYFVIPYTSATLFTALLTLYAVLLSFELTFVGGLPLLTEVLPAARSVVLSTGIAAGSLGRMLGALAGPLVWEADGLRANAWLGAFFTLIAILVLTRWVREGSNETLQP